MEHWEEYGSSIEVGIEETYRILKQKGKFIFNVPMLSHGHEMFVKADVDAITNLFDKDKWRVTHVEEWRKNHDPLLPHKAWKRSHNRKIVYKSYKKCGQEEPSTWILDVVVRKR
jgi:hypothetical protein